MSPPTTASVSAGSVPASNLERVCGYLLSDAEKRPEVARPQEVARPPEVALAPEMTRTPTVARAPRRRARPRPWQPPRRETKTCVVASAPGVPFRSFLALNLAVEAARQRLKVVLIDRARKLVPGEFAPEWVGPEQTEHYRGHFGLRLVLPPADEDLPADLDDVELFLMHAPASPVEELVRVALLGDTLVMPIGPDPRDTPRICSLLDAIGRAGRIPTPHVVVVGAAGVREAREAFSATARAIRAVSGVGIRSAGFVILDAALRSALASGRPLSVSAPYAASTRSLQGVTRLVVDDVLSAEPRSREEWDA